MKGRKRIMKNQVNKTKKTRERKTKDIHVRLSNEEYALLEERKEKRNLDTRNYITYLIRNDKDDFQCSEAADALNKISAAAEGLSENCYRCQCDKECMIRPFTIDIMEGVKELWRYSR